MSTHPVINGALAVHMEMPDEVHHRHGHPAQAMQRVDEADRLQRDLRLHDDPNKPSPLVQYLGMSVNENDGLAEYRYHSGICMKLQAAVTSVVPRRPSAMTWRS